MECVLGGDSELSVCVRSVGTVSVDTVELRTRGSRVVFVIPRKRLVRRDLRISLRDFASGRTNAPMTQLYQGTVKSLDKFLKNTRKGNLGKILTIVPGQRSPEELQAFQILDAKIFIFCSSMLKLRCMKVLRKEVKVTSNSFDE
jgi:hypothetical protein